MENKVIRSFAIFKNTKATGNQPGYEMVGKDEQGNKIKLASIWLKDHQGTKYYSGQMKDEFVKDDGTKYDGYVIISQAEYDRLKNPEAKVRNDVEEEDINVDDIPF